MRFYKVPRDKEYRSYEQCNESMEYTKNSQRDLEVIEISSCYCRKLHPKLFSFLPFSVTLEPCICCQAFREEELVLVWLCQGREALWMFLSLVPDLWPCFPISSGIR